MEEQTAQSSDTYENQNQNSTGLLPGKIDQMDSNYNGLLSYGDNEQDEGRDTEDVLMHEKQFSEISSTTDMTVSTSQDTGFGSATVSEVPSPVENNDAAIKPLSDDIANKLEDDICDSASDDTTNEIEVLPNDLAVTENDVSVVHKRSESTNNEKVEITIIHSDEGIELAAQKEEADTFFDNEDENLMKTDTKTEDKCVEKIEQKEMEVESAEKTTQQEAEGESVEKTAQQETESKSVEKTTQQKAEGEIAVTTVQQETVGDIVETTWQEKDESVQKTVHREGNFENDQQSLAEDENNKQLVNDKSEDHSENVVLNKTETRCENVSKESSFIVGAVNTDKAINGTPQHEVVEYAEHDAQNTENAETGVPKDKKIAGEDQMEADYGREAHKPTGNENICQAEENKVNEATAGDVEVAGEDVENISFNKAVEGSVSNTYNILSEFENIEQAQSKQMGTDNNVENEIDKPEDKHAETSTVDDNPDDESGATNSTEDDNTKDEICHKTENQNLEDAEDDKADDEKDNVMDILGNGLLKKKILVPGKGINTRPTNGDIVTVKVDGQLLDGTHVDTGEISFSLNDGDVILAFDLAVALMEEGEKCELYTSERYAYGSLGRDPDIPKDTSITYVLELVNVVKPPDVSEINFEQRLKMGEAKRERGNYLFGRADYSGAINSYNKAVKLLDNQELNGGIDENCYHILTESWVKCYNNLAASQLKIDALDAAIKSCERVLSVQENNVKALFRLGKAYGTKGEVDQALFYLRKAAKLDPESKLMQQELLNLTRRKNKEMETEKALYTRMLGVKPGAKSLVTEEEKKRSNSNRLIKWTLVAGGVAAILISVGLSWYRAS